MATVITSTWQLRPSPDGTFRVDGPIPAPPAAPIATPLPGATPVVVTSAPSPPPPTSFLDVPIVDLVGRAAADVQARAAALQASATSAVSRVPASAWSALARWGTSLVAELTKSPAMTLACVCVLCLALFVFVVPSLVSWALTLLVATVVGTTLSNTLRGNTPTPAATQAAAQAATQAAAQAA